MIGYHVPHISDHLPLMQISLTGMKCSHIGSKVNFIISIMDLFFVAQLIYWRWPRCFNYQGSTGDRTLHMCYWEHIV